jgi:hypothetical protein
LVAVTYAIPAPQRVGLKSLRLLHSRDEQHRQVLPGQQYSFDVGHLIQPMNVAPIGRDTNDTPEQALHFCI